MKNRLSRSVQFYSVSYFLVFGVEMDRRNTQSHVYLCACVFIMIQYHSALAELYTNYDIHAVLPESFPGKTQTKILFIRTTNHNKI